MTVRSSLATTGLTSVAVPRGWWLLALALVGIAAALALLPLSWAIALAAGGLGLGAILIRPVVGLALLALAVPFGYVQTVSVAGAQVSGVEAVLAMLVLAWGAGAAARRQAALRPLGLVVAALLFVLLAALSVRDATTLAPALKETVKWLEFALALGLSGSLVRTPRDAAIVLIAAAIAGALAALPGWYQFLFRVGPPSYLIGDRFLRAYGTFGQPNPFAGYLSIVLMPALAVAASGFWFLVSGWGVGNQKPETRNQKPALFSLSALCVVVGAAILMSFSRGAWLGLVVAGAVGLALLHRQGVGILLVGVGLLAALGLAGSLDLLPDAVAQRLGSVAESIRVFDAREIEPTSENWASVERMANWQAAWAMFQGSPLTGIGFGNFSAVYQDYALPAWRQFPAPHAHNYYLNLLAETGAIGLAGYAGLMAATLVWVIAVWRRCARRDATVCVAGLSVSSRTMAAAVVAIVVYVWTHSLFDDLFVHGIAVQVALSLGILAPLAVEQQ
ncbi:MAG: O-antigen ligase family protein [Chloroflexi bacterium]|nr:O-antigen ligase family protein [Chloroflexota bacterium]